MRTVFKGETNECSNVNCEFFIPFIMYPREGERNNHGDPFSIMLKVGCLLTAMCTEPAKNRPQQQYVLRESLTKPLFRSLSNVMCQTRVCNFIFENEIRLNNTIDRLINLASIIKGKDDIGFDPNSAMEGLIFSMIALLDIHGEKHSKVISKKVKAGIAPLFLNNKEMKYLYDSVAIPSSLAELRKWNNTY